jgi:N-dimethylarginine dimethylaminohydrolase
MSPPPPTWRIRGGANYKSVSRAKVSPRRALGEWLALADAVEESGAVVSIVPPPADVPVPLTGLMYTANAGWLRTPSHFRVARLTVAHRQGERSYLASELAQLFGWEIEESRSLWEGQADMCRLSAATVILSYGVRSTPESVDEVTALLPDGQQAVAVRLREPFFHGDTCMNVLRGKIPVFMVHPLAFDSPQEYARARGAASKEAEILEISEADALAYACNSLSLGDQLLIPVGLSEGLRSKLQEYGYRLVELDFTELFGKGGGGPRCLVNDLGPLSQPPMASRYADLKTDLRAGLETYPLEQPD